MQNRLSSIILVIGFFLKKKKKKKSNIITFSVVNYAEIGRVGTLEAEIQQVPLVPALFSEIFTIFLWHIRNFQLVKKTKK